MQEPRFSIIIPVYNDIEDLSKVLTALKEQTIGHSFFETIIVDNGSTQNIEELCSRFPNIQYREEKKYLNSPYSCRNRGIEISKGSIIVLLDATCVPVAGWLEEASKCFSETNAEIIAGAVSFRFEGSKPTTSEALDSIMNIKMKESVLEKKVAKTANLFIKKELFQLVGLFDEGIRSGGDVSWTKKATDSGCSLIYCDKAEVFKSARKFKELFIKQFRVGKGQPKIWNTQGRKPSLIKICLLFLKPASFKNLKKLVSKHPEYSKIIVKLYLVFSIMRLTQLAGNLKGTISLKSEE